MNESIRPNLQPGHFYEVTWDDPPNHASLLFIEEGDDGLVFRTVHPDPDDYVTYVIEPELIVDAKEVGPKPPGTTSIA